MSSHHEYAEGLIRRSKLSPVEKNFLIYQFLGNSYDPDFAAREIIHRVDHGQLPAEEALRGLKHDWYRVLELLSKPCSISNDVKKAVTLRDGNQCRLTGRADTANANVPVHILSPALLELWVAKPGKDSIRRCFEAFVTSNIAEQVRCALSNTSIQGRLANAMLLSPAIAHAFRDGDIWLKPVATEPKNIYNKCSLCHDEIQPYCVYGFPSIEDGSDAASQQEEEIFDCIMHTCDAEKLLLPSPLLLDVHGRLAKAANISDPEREVAKPWPASESQTYWRRKWQLRFRFIWLCVPHGIRAWVYQRLFNYATPSAISEVVYSLPFGLYAKFCTEESPEPAALQLLEECAPGVPAPLYIDTATIRFNSRPCLFMTGLPGRRLDEVIHRMSYKERNKLADDLSSALNAYKTIPNRSAFCIASASGGRIQDPRTSSSGCGPYHTEADFNRQISRGCYETLVKAIPDALSKTHQINFTHADLFPSNILVDGGRLSGIVDWQFAGFYPDYWEYTKTMRAVHHLEQYESIFRRIFGRQHDAELATELFLADYFPIWGPPEPEDSES